MKNLLITAVFFSAFAISCNDANKTDVTVATTDTASTSKPADQPDVQMDSATMMKNWQAFMTPGEPHKMLAKSNGTWNGDITMWMSADAPPQKMTGTAENKMILNGLYQQGTHKGMYNGMPFEGISTTAYDNIKKMFISSWVDNMGSGIMHMEGPWDEATKTITMKGSCSDPMSGKTIEVKEIMKFIDDKNQMMEMYEVKNGKERKTMEIKFTKK